MIYIEEVKDQLNQTNLSEIARVLLLKGLKEEFGISSMPEWSFEEFGKPFFKDYPYIHFNLSHCSKVVVCGVSESPIGIDVECIDIFDEELAKYVTTESEFEKIKNSEDPALAFTILWTKKESYLKLTGQGLLARPEIQNILNNNSSQFQTFINKKGCYVVSYCKY